MDIKLKSSIKKFIFGYLRKILFVIYNRGSNPYSLKSSFFLKVNISDFFITCNNIGCGEEIVV